MSRNDILSPRASLKARLTRRIANEASTVAAETHAPWVEPDWREVAPGISCKVLAYDAETHFVSMLVRLLPNVEYPPHTHAGIEELFLLDGELWIDDRKLYSGDYSRAEAFTRDERVWSETGCTCVLVTSTCDEL